MWSQEGSQGTDSLKRNEGNTAGVANEIFFFQLYVTRAFVAVLHST